MIKPKNKIFFIFVLILAFATLCFSQETVTGKVERGITKILGGLLIPVLILMAVIGLLVTVRVVAKRYKRIPPNAVGVFYGRHYKDKKGFRIVCGGGKVLFPIVEEYYEMDTSVFQVELEEHDIPNMDNVKITVTGIATCKVSTIPEDLENAARAFLKKDPTYIKDVTKNILLGHLRSIIGKMSVESIIRDRDTFNQEVASESQNELKNIGIEVKTLVIQKISDDAGYIDALGMGKTAEVKRDAAIRVAEADREARIKTTTAQKEAETVAAANEALIAQAKRDRDLKMAGFKAEVDTKNAVASQAGPLSLEQSLKGVLVAKAEKEAAEKEAQIKVQTQEVSRREQELTAQLLKLAEVERNARIVKAEGEKKAAIIEAEGRKQSLELEGQGQGAKVAAQLEGEAKGHAAQVELLGKAEGAAIAAKLLAEAEGILKKAEALEKLDKTGRLITVMEKLPPVSVAIGNALGEVAKEIFQGIAAPLGNIDSLNVVDLGGGDNSGGLNKLANLVPSIIFNLMTKSKALGIDFKDILAKVGIDVSQIITRKPEASSSSEKKSKSATP